MSLRLISRDSALNPRLRDFHDTYQDARGKRFARERPQTSKTWCLGEELRRERATEAEPAPLLLERFLMVTPVAAAPKE